MGSLVGSVSAVPAAEAAGYEAKRLTLIFAPLKVNVRSVGLTGICALASVQLDWPVVLGEDAGAYDVLPLKEA